MNEPILQVDSMTKMFGGFVALDSVSLHLNQGERLGLIGPNGSGKTTMINCISGALNNDDGSVLFRGKEIQGLPAYRRARMGIARSFQIPRPFRSMTVLENLCLPIEYAAADRIGPLNVREQGMEILETISFVDRADELSADLTQVDLRKLELARAMAAKPTLLVSDEAMAGLSSSQGQLVTMDGGARQSQDSDLGTNGALVNTAKESIGGVSVGETCTYVIRGSGL